MPFKLIEPQLVDRIYEAAVATELWPAVLEDIGQSVNAMGAVFISISPSGTDWICASRLEKHMSDYAAAGWAADTEHTGPLFADTHAGFRAETAYRTVAEIEALPVKREFIIPRGLIAAAASVFQGASNDALYMTVEGFCSHTLAERAVPVLDQLRPHIGRALSLSSKVRQARTDALVSGLEVAGVGAAVLGRDRKLRAANETFQRTLGAVMIERVGALLFTDAFVQAAVEAALACRADESSKTVASVGVRISEEATPIVLHLVPLRGRARDVCGSDGVLMLTARAANEMLPNADLLKLLFDLTPAEAQIARLLAEGMTIAQVSRATSTSQMTVRTQLRSVFLKTGTRRQVDLVRLLISTRIPVCPVF